MILSHKYKFIFLRTCKTAGSSLEIALSKHCGPDDIITPDREEDEKLRLEVGGTPPQNYQGDIPLLSRRGLRKIFRNDPSPKFFHHMQARDVKAYIDPDIWNSYYKFAFERNPWDRAISLYYWRYKQDPRPSFYEFIKKGRLEKTVRRQSRDVYRIGRDIAVDRVCLYENLNQELDDICKRLSLPQLDLPRAKSTQRKDKKPYTESMNETERDMIAKIFDLEIKTFGYRFGENSAMQAWERSEQQKHAA